MKLNELSPGAGAKKVRKRVGRGMGSGLGKTGGRGHKGLKSRSGGTVNASFEGGQMPIQRRVPKFGFTSRVSRVTQEVRLGALQGLSEEVVNLNVLKSAGLIRKTTRYVKIMLSGTLVRAMTVTGEGISISKGARDAIATAGGKVEV